MGLTYLHNRNGSFYFRMGLPMHLQKICGQREWVYALQTKTYAEAKHYCTNLTPLAHALLMKIDHLFRSNAQLETKQVQEIVRGYFTEALRRLKQQKSMYEKSLPFLEAYAQASLGGLSQEKLSEGFFEQPFYLTPDSLAGIKSRDSKGQITGKYPPFGPEGLPTGMNQISFEQVVGYALKQHKLTLDPNSVAYKQVSNGIEQAINELQNLQRQYAENQPSIRVKELLFADLVAVAESPLWSEVYPYYLDFISKQEALTIENKRTTYIWFQDFYGDLPIQAIKKNPHATGFRDALTKLPTNASKFYPKQTFKQWVGEKGKKISERRINIYLSCMKSLFTWAKDQGIYEGENPFGNIAAPKAGKVKQAEKKGPYSADQLATLFASPIYTGHARQRFRTGPMIVKDSLYWIPLLALFTGARREELCQLKTTDIRKEQGIWVVNIDDAGDNHLKNDNSIRQIPLHPQLEKLGFLAYHQKLYASRAKMLFPDLTFSKGKQRWGNEFGKKYNTYIKNIKLRVGREDFHSFRHTLTDALRAAGIPTDIITSITGHKDGRIIAGYGKGFTLKQRYDALAKVRYPSIDWAKVGMVKPLTR